MKLLNLTNWLHSLVGFFTFQMGGGGSGGGAINIELLLSPDLEARIVKNTLGQTANIITRTQRTK